MQEQVCPTAMWYYWDDTIGMLVLRVVSLGHGRHKQAW